MPNKVWKATLQTRRKFLKHEKKIAVGVGQVVEHVS